MPGQGLAVQEAPRSHDFPSPTQTSVSVQWHLSYQCSHDDNAPEVFQAFVMPTELLKIDRLVDGVAQIWWRQHEQLAKKLGPDPLM